MVTLNFFTKDALKIVEARTLTYTPQFYSWTTTLRFILFGQTNEWKTEIVCHYFIYHFIFSNIIQSNKMFFKHFTVKCTIIKKKIKKILFNGQMAVHFFLIFIILPFVDITTNFYLYSSIFAFVNYGYIWRTLFVFYMQTVSRNVNIKEKLCERDNFVEINKQIVSSCTK